MHDRYYDTTKAYDMFGTTLWTTGSFSTNGGGRLTVSDDGTIYFTTSGDARALSSDGNMLWSSYFSWHVDYSTPVLPLTADVVYLNSLTYMYALNATDGSVLWDASNSLEGLAFAMEGDALYAAGTGSNTLSRIDRSTGASMWSSPIQSATCPAEGSSTGTVPAINHEGNIIAGAGHTVSAFTSEGNVLWNYCLPENEAVGLSPIVVDGNNTAYFVAVAYKPGYPLPGLAPGRILAVSSTGSLLWEHNVEVSGNVCLALDNQNLFATLAVDGVRRLFTFRTTQPPTIFSLSFPLKGTSPGTDESLDPYKAPVVSVFDHSMSCLTKADPKCPADGTYRIYGCDEAVEAYTGEIGNINPDVEGCRSHPGYTQEGDAPFYVNGHYVGSGGDTKYLNYDGHPGIDYQAGDGTEVYAAVSGTVHYPKSIVGIRRPNAAYKVFHVLELVPDGFPDYKIYYLHLSTHPATGESVEKEDTTPGCPPIVDLPLPEGTHIDSGCLIALSGQAGSPGSPHLHFEVQKVIPIDQVKEEAKEFLECIDDEDKACVPVDPYGWDGDGSDPYESLTSVSNARLWAHLPVVNSVNPTSVSTGVFDLTITGEGFDSEAADCLIQKSDDYSNPLCLRGTILSQSSTQLVIQENLLPDTYFVHVENGDGRRSNWKKLVVSGGD